MIYSIISLLWSSEINIKNYEYVSKLIEGFIIIIILFIFFDYFDFFSLCKKYIPFILILILIIVCIEVFFNIHLEEINLNHIRINSTDLPAALYYNTLNLGTIIFILFIFIFYYYQSIEKNYILPILFLILMIGITLLTTSRVIIISMTIFLIVNLFIKDYRNKTIFILASIILILITFSILFNDTIQQISIKASFNDGSATLRTTLYKLALDLFPSNVFGLGAGSAELFFEKKINININAHSTWLELFINFGLVGFILFNLFHFYLVYQLYKIILNYKKRYSPEYDRIYKSQVLGGIMALLFLPIVGFAGSSIIRSLSILWILYGYIIIMIKNQDPITIFKK